MRLTSKTVRRKFCHLGAEVLESRALLAGTTGGLSIVLHLGQGCSPAGDYAAVTGPRVVLRGQTSPEATVYLGHTNAAGKFAVMAKVTANAQGVFGASVNCGMGTNSFIAVASDPAGDQASATLSVTRANQVVAWNSIALQAVRTAHLQAPDASRAYAIVAVSVYDAVNAIDPRYQPYAFAVKAPAGASADAAAAGAAYVALLGQFPSQANVLNASLAVGLASIPAGDRAKLLGVTFGESVAARMLGMRSADGSGANVSYTPAHNPDSWVPTPPAFAKPVDPQWGNVTPFALTSGSQFKAPPPPDYTSAEFAAEVNQVEALGGTTSTVRTADQTALARFWSDLAGTFDPPGHWNQITEIAAVRAHCDLEDSARAFALVNMALDDAGIEAWGVKYQYATARPVTVIRDGLGGANPGITADPTWTPLWATPPFPSYISGHSTFSAAAAAVLDSIYGDNFPFSDPGDPTLNLPSRSFASFDAAAQEAGMSRIYGGIHFMSDNVDGLLVGGEVGQYVAQTALKPSKS